MTYLARLNELFERDPLIDEIGLIFGSEEQEIPLENAFILEEHKLGVAFGIGFLLFREAADRFHELNPILNQLNEIETQELLNCTRGILLISADFYTAWNTRKEFISRRYLMELEEVKFCDLVLTLHPKSIDTWAYRRWLALRVCRSAKQQDKLYTFFNCQIEKCSTLADRYPRNYHAWSFRHWIISRLPEDLLEYELKQMHQWCSTHIKDHSGWNHRQYILRICLRQQHQERWNKWKLLTNEYNFLSEILALYPEHEALWCHRRFVVQGLLNQLHDESQIEISPNSQGSVDPASILHVSQRWKEIHTILVKEFRSMIRVQALFEEISLAWSLEDNRFGRRYALWILEQFSNCCTKDLFQKIHEQFCPQLAHKDPLLKELWVAKIEENKYEYN